MRESIVPFLLLGCRGDGLLGGLGSLARVQANDDCCTRVALGDLLRT